MKKTLVFLILCFSILSLVACSSEDENMISDDLVDYGNYFYKTGSYTTTQGTYGYTDESSGISNVSTSYVSYIADENGIIEKIYIDEVESNIYFDGNGQLSNYADGEILTKKMLGDNYGMRDASPIKKEWYEQIEALEDYMVGKNITTFLASPNAKSRSSYSNYPYDENYDYYTNYSNTNEYGYDGTYTDGYIVGNGRNITPSENYAMEITTDSSSEMDSSVSSLENTTSDDLSSNEITSSDTTSSDTLDNSSDLNTEMDSWKNDLTASVTIDTTNIMKALQNAYESTR